MVAIIQRHNRLNGLIFSIVEFGFIAVLVATYATYYLFHNGLVMAIIGWGITLNCVPVVVIGLRQMARDRTSGTRIGSYWDKEAREQLQRENPHRLRDTLILCVVTLLPFVSMVAVLSDFLKLSKS
jgi:hypothetical protein